MFLKSLIYLIVAMNNYNKVILNREVEFEILVCLVVILRFDHQMAHELWLNVTSTLSNIMKFFLITKFS